VVCRLGGEGDGAIAVAPLGIRKRPPQQLVQVPRLERQQAKQARAADQRLVYLEGGVLGGGTDQGEGAVLHPGQ
jgi:hypothetical protein